MRFLADNVVRGLLSAIADYLLPAVLGAGCLDKSLLISFGISMLIKAGIRVVARRVAFRAFFVPMVQRFLSGSAAALAFLAFLDPIVSAVALKGEVKIYSYSDNNRRFEELDRLLLEDGRSLEIENIRYQNNMVIAKFAGTDDRNAAESLKDLDVFITEDELSDLPEDTYYIRDLIGCAVCDYETGGYIGEIEDVIQNSAQDLYQIKLETGKFIWVPAVAEFVKDVDIKGKRVKVSLIPGFTDEGAEA